MPPKKAASKRKASASPSSPSKKSKSNGTTNGKSKSASNGSKNSDQYKDSTVEIEHGIVQREFYPPEMVNSRCIAYIEDEIERPIETLQAAVEETNDARDKIEVKDAVLHWFKCDLRTKDNRALSLASQKAKEAGVPLIAMYIVSPQDFQAHLTAPVRVDFILRTLEVLKEDLAKLDIPLYVETVEKRRNVPGRILDLCTEWGVSHIFANMEYEVDELRREAKLTGQCLEKGIALTVVHDTCVVPPGNLHSQSSGKDFAVYSPWYRAWMAHVQANQDLLEEFDVPAKNPGDAKKKFKSIFESEIPEAPENKKLTDAEKKRFGSMWPAGEKEAHHRLEKFLSQKIKTYDENRNLPAGNGTAVLSLHFASGTLSARTAVREAREANSTKKLNGGNSGIASWISEVAWRDFYKHVLVNWPFVCMNKSFKPEYTNIEWEYNTDHFQAWCNGQTGYPIVDAAMRQLNHSGYMHNRCRMIVASFLAKDLLIDWRMGERYFMEHLIDGDFASNNGGWGFSSSTGVDPQPYFRIFNPLLQSEKFDPDGDYIRRWVPELKDVKGKAIHEPYTRGEEKRAEENGYPRPVIEHKFARDRALARYKEGLGRSTA